MLALALGQSGDAERAATTAQDAADAFEAAGDGWGIALSSLIRAIGAAHAGDASTVAVMAAAIRRHSDAIGYDAFRVPALLLEAWVAERRQDGAAAVDAYRRALELAGGVGFGDHAAFALAGLGANALASGDLREAEELQRQALVTAEAAQAPWVAAHARVQLGRIAAASGDPDGAERLYREVLEWSQTAAAAPGAREPLPRARRQPGRGGTARARGDRGARLSWQNRRRAWQSVGIGAHEPSCCQRTEQEARHEHNHDRGPACAGAPPDRPAAGLRTRPFHLGARADRVPPRSTPAGGGGRSRGGVRRARRGRGEARAAEDEARRRRALAGRRRLRRLGDVRRRRRGGARELGHLPRAAADERRVEGMEGARAGRGGDRRRPQPIAVGRLRARRIEVDERLAQARGGLGHFWQSQRQGIIAARDELEQQADELSARIK